MPREEKGDTMDFHSAAFRRGVGLLDGADAVAVGTAVVACTSVSSYSYILLVVEHFVVGQVVVCLKGCLCLVEHVINLLHGVGA